jgi:hypothetical protein
METEPDVRVAQVVNMQVRRIRSRIVANFVNVLFTRSVGNLVDMSSTSSNRPEQHR